MNVLRIFIVVALAVVVIPSGVSWAKKPPGAKTYAKAHKCTSSKKSARRAVTLRGTMSTPSRDLAMRMRYELYEKVQGGDWQEATPSKLDKWLKKPAGVDLFRSRFRVRNLSAPARYKAIVRYEWTRDGELVGRARKTTNICKMRSKQPDLSAKFVVIRPGLNDLTWSYVFVVSNLGSRTAKGFRMEIRIGGGTVIKKTVKSLRRYRAYKLDVVDRRCSEAQIEGVVDPDDDVTEGNEKNNSVKVNCPLL